ncbi:MAG TPA: alkaline phosphatase family protein [Lacunisphaera sp.]|nr:alkaline phosphatase family protein [Lacunisphaera sp.]
MKITPMPPHRFRLVKRDVAAAVSRLASGLTTAATFGMLLAGIGVSLSAQGSADLKTQNVVLVTIDGLRWQEVFRGADDGMANKEFGGVSSRALVEMQRTFATGTPWERRRTLMPFVWGEIAQRGQIFGNRDAGSAMRINNAAQISYPGYNEMLTGFADLRIKDNARIPNPNVTVLEWLNGRPGFAGRVVPLAAWNVFAPILNVERSRLPLWLTNQRSDPATASPQLLEIERWMRDIPTKGRDEHYDAFVFRAALDAIETKSPRLLFVGFGEPDTFAHARAYDHYLESIQRVDRFIREFWEKLQSLPQYRGTTTLVITTDHGRGDAPSDWANHNPQSPGSEATWLMVLGPDTPPLGERRKTAPLTTSQVAATVARFLGEDFRAAFPRAAEAVPEVFPAPVR